MFIKAKRISDGNEAAVNLQHVSVLRATCDGCCVTVDGDEYEVNTQVVEVLRLARIPYIDVGDERRADSVEYWEQEEGDKSRTHG